MSAFLLHSSTVRSILQISALCFFLGLSSLAQAQKLVIESWRKDDQVFWAKVLIPAFQRQHPGIRLEFSPEEPLAYDSKVETRLATRRAGDLVFCRPFEPAQRMHDKGYLQALDEDLLRPFSAQARRAWTTEDGRITYCLPVAYVVHGLFYNKALFRQHRLQPPATTEEFLRLLESLSRVPEITPLALGTADMWEATQVVFTGLGPVFWKGEQGRQGLLKGQRRFTDPEFLAAWQFMSRLRPYMHPDQRSMGNSDVQLLFASGNAAVYPSGSWDIDYLRNTSFAFKKPIELGVFKPPVPKMGERCQLSVHPDFGIGISRHTRHPQAALQVLRWMASAEFAQLLTDTLSGYFSLSSHPVALNDPLSREMIHWRSECDETIRINAERMNRVWPPMEEELWYTNVKVINQEMSAQEAGQRIQQVLERNTYLPNRPPQAASAEPVKPSAQAPSDTRR